MKRSEYNKILERIAEHEIKYGITSINNEQDPYFDHGGCEICSPGLGNEVYDAECIKHEDIGAGKSNEVYEYKVCGACINVIYNGDLTGLDGAVTEEDEE